MTLLIVGLSLGSWSLYQALLMEHISLAEVFNIPALMIVIGCSLGATLIETSGSTLKLLGWHLIHMLWRPSLQSQGTALIEEIMRASTIARDQGKLDLEKHLPSFSSPQWKFALQQIIDGYPRKALLQHLEEDLITFHKKHQGLQKFFLALGGYCPTFGILGAVLGLIQVLKKLQDPASLGQGIAVAFIATIYGVFFANVFFIPLAGLSKIITDEQITLRKIILQGALGLLDGQNPRILQQHLQIILQGACLKNTTTLERKPLASGAKHGR